MDVYRDDSHLKPKLLTPFTDTRLRPIVNNNATPIEFLQSSYLAPYRVPKLRSYACKWIANASDEEGTGRANRLMHPSVSRKNYSEHMKHVPCGDIKDDRKNR
jgi:hypothetical protein